MKGKRKTQDPCEKCFLHRERCLCASIPILQTRTRLCLVIHAKEVKRTTNTGILATRALPNSEIFVRGQSKARLDLSSLLRSEYQPLLFFPTDDAVELSAEFIRQFNQPILLIVPDGNWRQASKVHYRHAELRDAPRVMIKSPNIATKHLRAESSTEGMATLQAIARAFGILEGDAVEHELTKLYDLKLDRTLAARGVAPDLSVL